MPENSKDYQFCIKVALDNAKNRINLLDNSDKKSVLDEYKEWINDGINNHTVLLIREDPIIQWFCKYYILLFVFEVTLNKKNRLTKKVNIKIIVKEDMLCIILSAYFFYNNRFHHITSLNSIFF